MGLIPGGYRLYLADNNPSATTVDEIDVYSITFDANGTTQTANTWLCRDSRGDDR